MPIPENASPIQSALKKFFLIPLMPSSMLVTSIPDAAVVSTMPSVLESAKDNTNDSPSTWKTPMNKVIREVMMISRRMPLLPEITFQPSFMLLKKGSGFLGVLVLMPRLTTAATITVRKNVQMSMMSISLMSLTASRKPAMMGEKRYLELPAIDTRPFALEYCSLVRRSVIVAV